MAFLFEILAIILAFHLGKAQQGACPKSDVPGMLVIVLSLFSVIAAFIAATFAGQYRGIGYLLSGVWTLLLFLGGFFLFFIASGGINWCGFVW